jgi:hypothetical protein
MSTPAVDPTIMLSLKSALVRETLGPLLANHGFTFHFRPCDDVAGSPQVYWYCWCGPLGKWDVECGPDCNVESDAYLTAVNALANFAERAERTMQDVGDSVHNASALLKEFLG